MVFKTRPFRQSAFLSPESASVARAELQQDVVDLLPKLASLAKCTNCKVVGDTIYFGDNGVFELDVTPLLPSRNSILLILIDRRRAPPGATIDYTVLRGDTMTTLYQGRLAVLDSSDSAANIASMLVVPLVINNVLRLSASNVDVPLRYFYIYTIRHPVNISFVFPFPSIINNAVITMWRLPYQPSRYSVNFSWNSLDGNSATITFREDGVDVVTFSTTSRTTIFSSVVRVWRRDPLISFSTSSNAIVKTLVIDLNPWTAALGMRALQSSYSTTSTSYVQYTPLNLSTVHARIRRIVVSASSNARWYVNVGGNTVMRSEWGISSIDFNPPVETYRVDLFFASADGANATASVIIIYDEVPGRL